MRRRHHESNLPSHILLKKERGQLTRNFLRICVIYLGQRQSKFETSFQVSNRWPMLH